MTIFTEFMPARTVALIEHYYAAFNAGDMDTFLGLLSETVVHDLNQGTREVGKAAFGEFMQRMNRSYREQIADITVMVNSDGTRAAAEYTVSGKYQITEAGLPAAWGQPYALRGGAFFEVQNDLITRVTNYYNLEEWVRQIDVAD